MQMDGPSQLQSTFPPILQDYLPGLKPRAKPSRPVAQGEATATATAGDNRLLEGKEAQKPSKTRSARVKVKDGTATTKLQSVSAKFKKEEDTVRRRKREKVKPRTSHTAFFAASVEKVWEKTCFFSPQLRKKAVCEGLGTRLDDLPAQLYYRLSCLYVHYRELKPQ